jgi:hypothetical protein
MSARAGVKVTEINLGIPRLPTKMVLGHTQLQLQLIPRFVWVKLLGRDVNHSGSFIFKGKNGWSYRHTPTIRLSIVDKENLTLLYQ